MKIRPAGAELFHADERTDMTKLIAAFRNFVNAPQKKDTFLKSSLAISRHTPHCFNATDQNCSKRVQYEYAK